MSKQGVEQVRNFKLGDVVPAATFARSANMAVTSKQTLVSVKDGAYVCIKGVEFTGNEKEFSAQCLPVDGKSIKVQLDGFGGNGTEISEVKIGKKTVVSAKITATSGVHDLYIILPEGCELNSWRIL